MYAYVQQVINNIVKWMYRDDIREFDEEYSKLIKGKQFPDVDAQYKNLEKILTYQEHKISSGDYVSDVELLKELGKTEDTNSEN